MAEYELELEVRESARRMTRTKAESIAVLRVCMMFSLCVETRLSRPCYLNRKTFKASDLSWGPENWTVCLDPPVRIAKFYHASLSGPINSACEKMCRRVTDSDSQRVGRVPGVPRRVEALPPVPRKNTNNWTVSLHS